MRIHPIEPLPQTRCSLVVGPVHVGGVDERRDPVHLLADRSHALAEGRRPRQLHQLGAGVGVRGDLLIRVAISDMLRKPIIS